MKAQYGIIAIILGLLPTAARAQEEIKVNGRVVDTEGKPVAGVEVGWYWNAQDGKMNAHKGAFSNTEGRFTLEVPFYGRSQGFLALDKERKSGALVVLEQKDVAKPVEIKLGPLVHVHGRFFCKEINRQPQWTMVYMMSGSARFLGCPSDNASFSFYLPPGKYKFRGYGTDIQDLIKDITLSADKPDFDMGTVDMAATVIARHKGKAPPDWHVTDARGVKKDVKISDFKGKWVLVEFWGFW